MACSQSFTAYSMWLKYTSAADTQIKHDFENNKHFIWELLLYRQCKWIIIHRSRAITSSYTNRLRCTAVNRKVENLWTLFIWVSMLLFICFISKENSLFLFRKKIYQCLGFRQFASGPERVLQNAMFFGKIIFATIIRLYLNLCVYHYSPLRQTTRKAWVYIWNTTGQVS